MGDRVMRKIVQSCTILFILVYLLVTAVIYKSTENAIKAHLEQSLPHALQSDIAILDLWNEAQKAVAVSWALNPQIRAWVEKLTTHQKENSNSWQFILDSPELEKLRNYLRPVCRICHYQDFIIANEKGIKIATLHDNQVGKLASYPIEKAMLGQTILSHKSVGTKENSRFTMWITTPVYSNSGDLLATLSFMFQPDFRKIFPFTTTQRERKIYIFDQQRVVLSQNPVTATLVNFYQNTETTQTSTHTESYSGYSGSSVVGAWTWLERYNLGITVEVDKNKSYQVLDKLGLTLIYCLALLISITTIFFFIIRYFLKKNLFRKNYLRRSKQEENTEVAKAIGLTESSESPEISLKHLYKQDYYQQLGQYTLTEKLGEGGMGEVHKANHSMLLRPCAIKFLHPEKANEENTTRFAREVQAISALTHPNTVIIYDYGNTPEGVFYYAMEYLPGINLRELIRENGPQIEARVIFILQQICASVAEAHQNGLIHRDIKPHNIMICERGGQMYDFVKVLDFGLAKQIDGSEIALTAKGMIIGTAHYFSPEAISAPENVDKRSDIYSIGALGYYLLTGKHVFKGKNSIQICQAHIKTPPTPPSKRIKDRISKDLEDIILDCLAKDPKLRPQNGEDLYQRLSSCQKAGEWGYTQAKEFWMKQEKKS